jgi:hypothetical protein
VLGAWGAQQSKKGKGKTGSGGAGGGPSTKAAAAAGSSRPSAPPARIIDLSTEEPAVQVAEATSVSQLTELEPAGGGITKKDKERQRMEEEMAALALRLQYMQAQLGVPLAAPAPHPDAEETMCVVCFDAPKEYAVVPCGHQCVCAGCAEQLTKTRTPTCPVCRGPIRETMKVFCS